jgi:hypothetical protein
MIRRSEMKSKVRVTKDVYLTLTEFEAKWLKAVMQNPLHGTSLNDECDEDNKMRKVFWDTLNDTKL